MQKQIGKTRYERTETTTEPEETADGPTLADLSTVESNLHGEVRRVVTRQDAENAVPAPPRKRGDTFAFDIFECTECGRIDLPGDRIWRRQIQLPAFAAGMLANAGSLTDPNADHGVGECELTVWLCGECMGRAHDTLAHMGIGPALSPVMSTRVGPVNELDGRDVPLPIDHGSTEARRSHELVRRALTDARRLNHTDPEEYPPNVLTEAVSAALVLAAYREAAAAWPRHPAIAAVRVDTKDANAALNDLLPLSEHVLEAAREL